MTNKCEICKNKDICKYKDLYENKFKKLEELDDDKTFPLTLDCIHYQTLYKQDIPYWAPGIKELTMQPTIVKTNACANCDFYKDTLMSGKPFIGDVPCQWCANSPTRVTCKTEN